MFRPGTLFLLLLLPWIAAAGDLYVAETPVADEGSETRNAALSRMLAEVLARVSGNERIASQPAAKEILDAAPSLAQEYRYQAADRDGGVARQLWVRFDQPAVERMLRERNLPVWVRRPRVLMWVATERGGQRELLNLDNHPAVRATVMAQAQRRGMPLQLPLMDLEDQTQLTPADVWSEYQAAIGQASARYPHDLVVTGRLRGQANDTWSGVWSLNDRGAGQGFQTPAKPLAEALALAIDQTQNLLAARYAPVAAAAGGQGTLVSVSDVYDLAAYGRLASVLDGLQTLAQPALRQVSGDQFVFEFHAPGSERDLARALEASGRLVAEPGTGDGGIPGMQPRPELHYRLID